MRVEAENNYSYTWCPFDTGWGPLGSQRSEKESLWSKHLEKRGEKRIKMDCMFSLFDKEQHMNFKREKLALWFPNSQRNYLKVTKI